MRGFILATAVLLCTYFVTGFTPKPCYECFSNKSWEDCNNMTTLKDCERGDDRCAQGIMVFTKDSKTDRIYFRTCAKRNECQAYAKDGSQAPTCADKKRLGHTVDCQLTCCEEDKCNASPSDRMVSVLLIMSCVFTACSV